MIPSRASKINLTDSTQQGSPARMSSEKMPERGGASPGRAPLRKGKGKLGGKLVTCSLGFFSLWACTDYPPSLPFPAINISAGEGVGL